MSSSPAVGTRHETNLTVLLADEDERALQSLAEVLQGLGHEVTPFAVSVQDATELIVREDPDLTIVVVHQDDDASDLDPAIGAAVRQSFAQSDQELEALLGRSLPWVVTQAATPTPGRDEEPRR